MACPSGEINSKQRSSLEQLIEEINFQRAKEMRQLLKDDSGFVMLLGTAYWTDLFVRHFLMEEERAAQESDDLLFFIRKRHLKEAKKYVPKYETLLEVQRRDSKKLPIGDPEIDWEETIYANLIIHRFDYFVTLAVCTRTSPKELQVLRRRTERVWASPSRRLMSDKGTSEEITYPNICFMLDNFDEAFTEIVVRDGEMVSVELVARDRTASLQSVIFLGSVRYDALRRVYDARTSLTTRMAQRMTFGLYSGADQQRMEFVRVRGPMGKGHAELAVTKPADSECVSPTASEPGCTMTEQLSDAAAREYCQHAQRRASDPSGSFRGLMRTEHRAAAAGSLDHGPGPGLGPGPAEDCINEVEADDPRAGMLQSAVGSTDSLSTAESASGAGQVGSPSSEQTADRSTKDGDSSRTVTEGSSSSSVTTPQSPESAEGSLPEGGAGAEKAATPPTPDGPAEPEVALDAVKGVRAAPLSVVSPTGRVSDVGAKSDAEAETRCPERSQEGALAGQSRHSCAADVQAAPTTSPTAGAASVEAEDRLSDLPGATITTTTTATATAVSAASAAARSGRGAGVRRASYGDAAAAAARHSVTPRHSIVTPGMLYRRACGQDGAAAAVAARCACARTPDGTVVHYRCAVQRDFLRQRELDDGVCNPMWSMRGLPQTLHFWREARRTASLPLSTYLTYVMLPWHAIISDIIAEENRQDPILSF